MAEKKQGKITLTPEEILRQEISEQDDAEQVRVYDLTLPGMPIKCVIERSTKLDRQLTRNKRYYELKDGKETVGYQAWDDEIVIEDYGKAPIKETVIVETRQRGE